MRMTCPACGAEMTLDVLIGHEGARAAIVAAMGLDMAMGKLLMQYLGLFRPTTRQLTHDRVATLLNELVPHINAAQIERNGRIWPAPRETWKLALEHMTTLRDKLVLPLKSHGYLFEVIAGMSNQTEAKAEGQREQRRAGHTPIAAQAITPIPPATIKKAMPEHIRAELKALTTSHNIEKEST